MQANSEAKPVRTGGHDRNQVRKLTVTAMLSAVAFVLMFLDFPTCPSCWARSRWGRRMAF